MKTILKIVIALLIINTLSGCATYKNPVPREGPYFIEHQLQPRFKYTIGIRAPEISDFEDIEPEWDCDFKYKWMLSEAKRLVSILNKTELFDDITLINDLDNSADIILVTIHRPPHPSDADNVWLLLYLGVFPVCQGEQQGVYFKFIKGGSGEFRFDWVEETIVSIYSWAISGLSKRWQWDNHCSSARIINMI